MQKYERLLANIKKKLDTSQEICKKNGTSLTSQCRFLMNGKVKIHANDFSKDSIGQRAVTQTPLHKSGIYPAPHLV